MSTEPTSGDGLDRLSLNIATTKRWNLVEALDGARRAGLGAVGLWRDRVAEAGLDEAVRLVERSGLQVSSLCRGGFMTGAGGEEIRAALADNRAAIDEAAALGASELVMVVGGLPASPGPELPATPDGDRDLAAARRRVGERLAELVPHAARQGVRIALEPMHPLFAADRGVLSTLAQCLDMAADFAPEEVGVVIDTYHVWWDPTLAEQIARAGREGRISSYQVNDFLLPLADPVLLSRGHVGDGYIDVPTITRWVTAAGYTGHVEVEIFNDEVWNTPGEQTVATMVERYRRHVLPHLG